MIPGNRGSQSVFGGLVDAIQPGLAFLAIICVALVAFEFFNFSTTQDALNDMMGGTSFFDVPWATILAVAFCGIDFAGIARLFTPEQGMDEPKEVWYLFGAWLLAATMNAILTWWGVSLAVSARPVKSGVIDPQTLVTIVPVFVAVLVWIIRILIIGTLSLALDRFLHPGAQHGEGLAVRHGQEYLTPMSPSQAPGTRASAAQQRYAQSLHASAYHGEPEAAQTERTSYGAEGGRRMSFSERPARK